MGQALEVLLQGTNYSSKYVTNPVPDELKNILADAGLVILPGDQSGQEKATTNNLISESTALGIPVLKLVTAVEEINEGLVHAIFWPCPIENLKQEIEVALALRP